MTKDPLGPVTDLLSSAVSDVGDLHTLPERRDEAIDKLGDALRACARRRRRRKLAATFLVAASLVAVATAGSIAIRGRESSDHTNGVHVAARSGSLMVLRDGREAPLGTKDVVDEGSELRTSSDSEAHLHYASGTRIALAGGTQVALVEQSKRKRFALKAGSLTANVAKLEGDERFVVATEDCEVEVRGTVLRVWVAERDAECGTGSTTRVDVSEGVVVVRHAGAETRIGAGEHWPRCPRPPAPRASASVVALPEPPEGPRPRPRAPTSDHRSGVDPVPTGLASATSQLASENALYSRAVQEKQSGNYEAAVASLDELIARHPNGPLTESAYLLRMRALASSDRQRGIDAARAYLAQYPNGFGRSEANALVAGEP